MNKVFGSAKEALAGVLKDHVMIGVGGFGLGAGGGLGIAFLGLNFFGLEVAAA